jgi:hypothetical protein
MTITDYRNLFLSLITIAVLGLGAGALGFDSSGDRSDGLPGSFAVLLDRNSSECVALRKAAKMTSRSASVTVVGRIVDVEGAPVPDVNVALHKALPKTGGAILVGSGFDGQTFKDGIFAAKAESDSKLFGLMAFAPGYRGFLQLIGPGDFCVRVTLRPLPEH